MINSHWSLFSFVVDTRAAVKIKIILEVFSLILPPVTCLCLPVDVKINTNKNVYKERVVKHRDILYFVSRIRKFTIRRGVCFRIFFRQNVALTYA